MKLKQAIVTVSTANKISAYQNTGYDNNTTEVEKIKYLDLQNWEKNTDYDIPKLSSACFVTRTHIICDSIKITIYLL